VCYCIINTCFLASALRKRDKLKKVLEKVKGTVFSLSPRGKTKGNLKPAKVKTLAESLSKPVVKGKKLMDDEKYENIDDLEEKAFQILLDLGMIQEHK